VSLTQNGKNKKTKQTLSAISRKNSEHRQNKTRIAIKKQERQLEQFYEKCKLT